ncbi:hypothetical protein NO2_0496 [Candidatus Termititenax persephonae]|uniref:Uncharacterized protein n=1 Tax=Candidatus Termititenax persephonae TaxID=2218525 RepID=A0A388THS4_9BACT|nr:hypothetical protein NO2_0496 [Candidatus Termititenax persephonae]
MAIGSGQTASKEYFRVTYTDKDKDKLTVYDAFVIWTLLAWLKLQINCICY